MPRRDLILLFIFALCLNFAAASFIREPGGLDDAYYFGGALRLAQGHGFTEPYLWTYLGDPQPLPQPSHLYWMPLTSIVEAIAMLLFGQSFAVARAPLVILASLLPLIAYSIAWYGSGLHRHAVCAGLLAIFCGFYPVFWGTTDSFALFGAIGALTLFGMGKALGARDWRLEIAVGVGAGLAHLTRADGILLLVIGVFLLARNSWQAHRSWQLAVRHSSFVIIGYMFIMLPWFIRNMLVVGSPLGNGGAGTLWMIEYNDLFNYPASLTPQRYFTAGLPVIFAGKWDALVINVQRIIAEQGWVFLVPLIALGTWHLRRHSLYRPMILYVALLYVTMTFVFSFPGARGGLFHSSVAFMPFFASACFVGLDAAIDWAVVRLPHWHSEKAKRNFSGLVVMAAVILTLTLTAPRLATWGGGGELFREIGATIPGQAVVMSNNPPGFWIVTGHSGIPLVNGDVPNLLAAADRYSAKYVLLDQNVTPGLAELYSKESGDRLQLIGRWGEWKLFEVSP